MKLITIFQAVLYFTKLAGCGDSSNTRRIFVRADKRNNPSTGLPVFVETYINRPSSVKGEIPEESKCYMCGEGLTFHKPIITDVLKSQFLDRKLVCTGCMFKNFVLNKSFLSKVTGTVIWELDRDPDSKDHDACALYIPDANYFQEITHFFPSTDYSFDIKNQNSMKKVGEKFITSGEVLDHEIKLRLRLQDFLMNSIAKQLSTYSYEELYDYYMMKDSVPPQYFLWWDFIFYILY